MINRLYPPPDVNNVLRAGLVQQFGDVPVLGDLIEIFTGIEDGDINDLASWVGNLFDEDGAIGIVINVIEDILSFITGFVPGAGNAKEKLAGVINRIDETAVSAASKINFTEIYNFETEDVRAKYPPNTASGFAYLNDDTIASSGEWVLRVQPVAGYAANASTLLSPLVEVASGENLYIEWKQRKFGNPNFRVTIFMFFYDADGAFLSYANDLAVPPLAAEVDEWETYAAQVVPPIGATKADVRAVLFENAGIIPNADSGWYVDDVVAGRVAMQSSIRGLQEDMATATNIANAANAAVAGQSGVVEDHENRITYLESGTQVAEFELDDDWLKPSSMAYHKVILVGGGGGGCGGPATAPAPRAYGGGPGGWAEDTFTNAELPSIVEILLGVGGIGGARRSGNTPFYGVSGTRTEFGTYLEAGGGAGASNNAPPLAGSGTRTDFQPFGGRGGGVNGSGDPGQNGYLCTGGAAGTGNGGWGGPGAEPPPGQYGPGSGGGGGAGNAGGGGDGNGGAGGYPGGGGGGGGSAMNWIGPEQGGAGGKGANGKAWVVSSPSIIP